MKISRLIWYGVAGVVTGLLVENKSLRTKDKVASKGRKLKSKVNKIVHPKS